MKTHSSIVICFILATFTSCSPKTESAEENQGPPPAPLEIYISPNPLTKADSVDDILAGTVIKAQENNNNSSSVLFGFDHDVWRLFLSQKKIEFYAGKQDFGGDIQISIARSDLARIKDVFSKFLSWDETANKENVQTFTKDIGTIGKTTFAFSYQADNKPYDRSKLIVTGKNIRQALVVDVQKYKELIRQIPYLENPLKSAIEEFQGLKQKQNKQGDIFK